MKKNETKVIETRDSRRLFLRRYAPEGDRAGVIHLLHGMGEHSGRYHEVASSWADMGFVVYLHDHRAHGNTVESEEELGLFGPGDTFDVLAEDVEEVHDYIVKREKIKDLSVVGHSMGSLILRRYLQKNPEYVKRAVIMGTLPRYRFMPLIMWTLAWGSGLFKKLPERNRFVYRLMNRNVSAGFNEENPHAWLSHDQEVQEAYRDDPLAGFVYNSMFYRAFFRMLSKVNKKKEIVKSPSIPLLFVSGRDDPLSRNMKTIEKLAQVYKENTKAEVTVMPVEGARHEVLNESRASHIRDDIISWINAN